MLLAGVQRTTADTPRSPHSVCSCTALVLTYLLDTVCVDSAFELARNGWRRIPWSQPTALLRVGGGHSRYCMHTAAQRSWSRSAASGLVLFVITLLLDCMKYQYAH